MTNPLLQLLEVGQSVWLDYLDRKFLTDGSLKRLIEEDGLRGLTSNPSIFEKAIAQSGDYDAQLRPLLEKEARPALDLYERLAVSDIQTAADLFRPVYDGLGGLDGYASIEVSPRHAMDTEATIVEAQRLWRAVDRPNVMIKVPATEPGLRAIRHLIGEGINVNVTLLFGIDMYLAVAEAHLSGLEALRSGGGDVSAVHGVASFFVSRIDTQIDKAIDARLKTATGEAAAALRRLHGKVAVANAKIAYQHYLDLVATPRWRALASLGASPQRLLWASTGVKNPDYPDTLYIDELIGPDTISTMPPKTLAAFRDHGSVRARLVEDIDEARSTLAEADALELDLRGVTDELTADGVRQFERSLEALLAAIAEKQKGFRKHR
jgi:transaldolase/glucose-6-phosphate isomerase